MQSCTFMIDGMLRMAEGAVSGAFGTLVITGELALAGKLPPRVQPTQPREHPGEFVVRKTLVATDNYMPGKQQEQIAHALHWLYGAGWGAVLGLVSRKLATRSLWTALTAGSLLGTVVWAVGYIGWLPATRLTPPIQDQGAGHALSSLGAHIVYGIATALPLAGLERMRAR